jgi:glucose/arabinose dehydrogenase
MVSTTRGATIAAVLFMGGCLAGSADAQLEPGEPAMGFELSDWVDDVREVTDLAFVSDGRAVITRKTGEIAVAMPDGSLQRSMAAIIDVDAESEKGLLGVVRDEDDTLYFYASTGGDDSDKHKVYRATLAANGEVSVDLTRSIIGRGLEGPANHDGGGMVIHRGQLYVGVGDTGYNNSPPSNRYGTCLNKANGKILRVNLDGSIPSDNPLTSLAMVTGCASPRAEFAMFPPDERIYAWGLRNPWRFWIDPATDLLWIGDVGEVDEEEITVGGKGAHHGWPFHEGNVTHGDLGGLTDCMNVVPASECVAPQHGYPRSDGVSVTGGLIPPAGCGWGAFERRYFFADFGTARMWTLDVEPDRSGVVPGSRRAFGRVGSAVSFRMGPDGAMYIASYGTSSIKRLAPKNVPATCGSATGSPPRNDAGAQRGDAGVQRGDAGAESDGGCGCNLTSRRPPGLAALIGGLGLLAVRRARRRRSHPGR